MKSGLGSTYVGQSSGKIFACGAEVAQVGWHWLGHTTTSLRLLWGEEAWSLTNNH